MDEDVFESYEEILKRYKSEKERTSITKSHSNLWYVCQVLNCIVFPSIIGYFGAYALCTGDGVATFLTLLFTIVLGIIIIGKPPSL